MAPDLTGILMFAFLGGGILTFIGGIVKFFNAGDILNFYDEKKQDKDKVSKLVGGDIFYTGILIIFIGIISIFLNDKFHYFIMMLQVIIMIIGLILSTYDMIFRCKKKNI